MNSTLISEEKLLEMKDLARKIEVLNKKVKDLELNILFGDRSDDASLRLRIETEKLTTSTEKLTKLILK